MGHLYNQNETLIISKYNDKILYIYRGPIKIPFPDNSKFTPLSVSGQPYFDLVGDESPLSTDLVGSSTFPSFFIAYDGANVYFRLRLIDDPRNNAGTAFRNFSWGVLFNTDGVAGTYEWDLAVNGNTGRLELIENTDKEFNTWNDPAEGTNGRGAPNFSRNIVNFDVARVTPADSNFGGNSDFFLDFFISAGTLFSYLGITDTRPIQMISFTSTNANNFNKDSLRTAEGFQFMNAFSAPVTAEEVDIKARLDVTKTLMSGHSVVTAGVPATYTARINVANTGSSQATTVFVRDVIGLDVLSDFTITNVGSGNAVFDLAEKVLSWNVGNLAAGEATSLTFNVVGYFTNSGSRTLEAATVTGIDNFTGNQVPPDTAVTTISVQSTGGIAGTVFDQSTSLPLGNVTVRLQQNGNIIATTPTNASGDYSFTGLAPGTYSVVYIEENYTTVSQNVTVTAGEISRANIFLNPLPGSIQGTVRAAGGGAVASAEVRLNDTTGVLLRQTATNASGQYFFTGLTPSQYNVTVTADGFQSASSGAVVGPNETETVPFILQPNPATIRGIVTDLNGDPIPGVLVEVLNEAGIVTANTTTNGAGQYTVDQLAFGTYRVRFSEPDFQTQILGVTLSPGEIETLNAALTPDPGRLTGTVTDSGTGRPLVGTSVRVVNSAGISVAAVMTGPDGSFDINSLAPGAYTVTVSADGFGSQNIGAEIAPGETTVLNSSLSRLAGTLTGVVTNTGGTPVRGALIEVYSNNVLTASAITDDNGSYTISNLSPGSYTVVSSAAGFSTDTTGAVIENNRITTVISTLQPNPGTLTGRVTTNSGLPIPGAALTVRESNSDVVVSRTVTDDNGNYVVSNLQPGNYAVTAAADDFQLENSGVIINSGQVSTVNFSLSPNPATITGTIINEATGEPIVGAAIEVRILDLNGNQIAATFSDTNGTYTIQNLAPGTYTVVVSAPDFQTNSASVTLTAGETENVSIGLRPSPGGITGSIVNASTGTGISGAVVRVTDANGFLIVSVLTDSEGNYQINGLAPGNYNVNASAESFQQGITGAIVQPNITTVINIGLAENPGTISGTVTPAIAGASIQLFTADNIFAGSTSATPQGAFRFDNLKPGQYILRASAPNFSASVVGATVLANQTTIVIIDLQPNPASVSGQVISTAGEPISNAFVRVLDANETVIGTGATDLGGSYAIGNLPPGTFSVVVTAPDFSNATGGVSLSPGETVTGLDFQLQPNPGALSGQVTDTNGNPIQGAAVIIRLSDGAFVTSVLTSQFGNFLVEGLAPESYIVVANADNFSTQSVGAIVRSNQTTVANVTLTNTTGDVRGRVVDQSGNLVTGNNIEIKLFDNSGLLLRAFASESDGTFMIFSLASGRYLINASAPGFTASTVPVDVVANEAVPVTVTLNPSPSTLTGRVVNRSNGQGIPGAFVTVTTPEGIFLAREVSGDNGSFTILRLPPNSVVASTTAENFGSDAVTAFLSPDTTTTITLALSPNPGSLTGFVTNLQSGNPIPGSVVIVSTATGAEVTNVVSDVFGQYLASGLDPGTYRAVVSAEDFAKETASFTISAGQTTVLSFALSPLSGAVQGTVRNQQTDQPVPNTTVVARTLSASGPIIAMTLTDEQGQYILTGLAAGSYTVVANAEGFGSAESSVNVPQNRTVNLDILLGENPAAVQGTVRSTQTGAVLPNTLIRLFTNAGVLIQSVQTDSDGFYRITGFSAGQYRLIAINPNFQREELSFTVTLGEVETVNFDLDPNPGSITGKITDAQTNSPLVGSLVLIFGASEVDSLARVLTDNVGNYTVNGLPPDTYTVAASAVNYARNSVGSSVEPNMTTVTNIALFPNPASIQGSVVSNTGVAIINATVKVIDNNGVVLGTAATDSNGNYAISNLPAGTFFVIVTAPAFASAVGGVTLNIGENEEGVDFVLTPDPGSIRGTVAVSGEPGSVVAGATVDIINQNGVTVQTTATNVNGEYFVGGLAPDSYTVVANKSGFSPDFVGAVVISDQTTTANLFLSQQFGTISGRVVDQKENPINGNDISVRLIDENGVILKTILAAQNGTFIFSNIRPGRYLINVTANGFQSAAAPVLVVANETAEITVSLMRLSGSVAGGVVNSATEGVIEGAQVTVTDPNGILLATIVTDRTGRFTVSGLPPGTVNITASKNGFGTDSKAAIIEAGDTATTLLSLSPSPGDLRGAVVNRNTGSSIAGASVIVIDFNNTVVATVLTETSGDYGVFNLEAGSYQVTASAENFDTQITSVEILPAQTTLDNFQLAPNPGNFSGRVTNGLTGEAIAGASVEVRTLGPAGPIVAVTLTNRAGEYVVTGLPPGVYTVVTSKENFGAAEASDQVVSNQTTTQNLILFPNPVSVNGRVVSSGSGEPLPDTLISLVNSGGAVVKEVQTDIKGFYLIEQFDAGTYTVVARNQNFQSELKEFSVEAGQTATVNFALENNPGRLAGRVIDAVSGNPISGAVVILYDQENRPIADTITDNDGNYEIAGIEPGTITVGTSALKFAADARTITINPNQTTIANFALARNPAQISGTVTSEEGFPIFDASVAVFDSGGHLVGRGLTGPNGGYVIGNLPSGALTAVASAPGFASESMNVVLSPGDEEIINFVLGEVPGNFSGQVTNALTGVPIPEAQIIVRSLSPAGPIVAATTTDEGGRYFVSGLAPGVYTIFASREGFGTAEASDEVRSGETTIQNLILLPDPSSVQGTVVSTETGEPVPNTLITLINFGGAVVKETRTDQNGFYRIDQFDAGSFSIVAFHPDFQSQTENFTVGTGETAVVNFSLEDNPGILTGRVTNHMTGEPLEEALVIVFNEDNIPIADVVTNEDGRYTIPGLAPGSYTARASAFAFAAESRELVIRRNQTTVANFTLVSNPATIVGRVTTEDGTPLFDASVSVLGSLLGRGFTGPNGEYVIGNLPAQSVTVTAEASGFSQATTIVTLEPGETEVVNFVLQATETGTITGLVVDFDTRQPISGATVTIRDLTGDVASSAVTDESGRFTVSGLAPLIYTVIATSRGYTAGSVTVDLLGGETESVVIVLQSIQPPVNADGNQIILIPKRSNQPLDLTGGVPTIFTLTEYRSETGCAYLTYQIRFEGQIVQRIFVAVLDLFNIVEV